MHPDKKFPEYLLENLEERRVDGDVFWWSDDPKERAGQLRGQHAELVRWWCESNPNTPGYLLELLVKDVDAGVRSWVAKNRRTSESLLEHLAKDVDVDVRWHVANNSNTPKSALELLVKDEDERVREEAAIGYFPRKKKWVFFT